MEALIHFTHEIGEVHFPILMFLVKAFGTLFVVVCIVLFIYDRYVQRENQLLINYPLIGRLRYLFYAMRDPMRQYFGDEKFYDLFDKVRWVYKAAEKRSAYTSFSPSKQPQNTIGIKHANIVLEKSEVSDDMRVHFGNETTQPFIANSVIGRSAMSDGAISPEGTQAFSKGAYLGRFPINTGEGGFTSNFLYTHRFTRECRFFEVVEGTFFAKGVYKIVKLFLNSNIAKEVYKHLVVYDKAKDSYLFDPKELVFYRINWNADLELFPDDVPDDIPDIIFQMGSGLYSVRDEAGDFCETRYQKTMRFCRMTEIKIAQGAKQTGGKLLGCKVSDEIAYYRGVAAHEDLISPNRFPYAHTIEELFDFIGKLKKLSDKPVGIKIVIDDKEHFESYAKEIATRVQNSSDAYPDFITIDGKDGGSGAAPLEMMLRVGLHVTQALPLAVEVLQAYGVRDRVKLIASEKVLTPDDVVVFLGLGADFVAIARAFMLSAGCIRARECSGANGRACPVGLATQDKRKRASFLVEQKALHVTNYHHAMLEGIKGLLAIMGVKKVDEITKEHLQL